MRKLPQPSEVCPIHGLLELLTRPWTLHILWALSTNGPARFGVLQKQVAGISSRVLAERLRGLEKKGFIFRHYRDHDPAIGNLRDHQKNEKTLRPSFRISNTWRENGSWKNPQPPGAGSQLRGEWRGAA